MTKVQALFIGGELHGRQEVLPPNLPDFVASVPVKPSAPVGPDTPVTHRQIRYRLVTEYRGFAVYATTRTPIENVAAALLRWVVERQFNPLSWEAQRAAREDHAMDAAKYQQLWLNQPRTKGEQTPPTRRIDHAGR